MHTHAYQKRIEEKTEEIQGPYGELRMSLIDPRFKHNVQHKDKVYTNYFNYRNFLWKLHGAQTYVCIQCVDGIGIVELTFGTRERERERDEWIHIIKTMSEWRLISYQRRGRETRREPAVSLGFLWILSFFEQGGNLGNRHADSCHEEEEFCQWIPPQL